MTELQHAENIHEIIKDVKFAMLTTETHEGHMHACPMTTIKTETFNGEIWFIGDKRTETVKDIAARPQINLSYSNNDDKSYVSINGTAELIEDSVKLDELWSDIYEAFFDGKDDPNIQLIKVNSHGAQYWKSGNSIINFFKLSYAKIAGDKIENLGTSESVAF